MKKEEIKTVEELRTYIVKNQIKELDKIMELLVAELIAKKLLSQFLKTLSIKYWPLVSKYNLALHLNLH